MDKLLNKIICGDCIEVMKDFPSNSVDAIVTDPPAGISFMGKEWDSNKGGRNKWIEWMSKVAKECLRVLKPGGHAFVWAFPRTSHWTGMAWENGGFEPRDVVIHAFGSGFPKSLSIGKAFNKLETKEWSAIGKALDNIDQKSIIEVWNTNSNNVKIVATLSEKSQTETGICMPKSDSVHESATENPLLIKYNVNVSIVENSFIEIQAQFTKESTVQQNVDTIITEIKELQNLATTVENSQQRDPATRSMNIFTAQCDVKEWLNENTEVNHKVDEALKTLRGNKKYSSEEITNVLCAMIPSVLKHTILNQSKTFQNLGTNQKTECASAINVIITEYTAENLISNTVAILKSKAVDQIQGNEREVVGINKNGGMSIENGMTFRDDNWEPETRDLPVSKGTSEWEGWGTALKPAYENWWLLRKPISEKSIAENCLKWGTGGINIEQSRVLTPDDEERKQKILAGEVVCNAFCDKHGLYPSSLDDMLSFSQQQLLDFYQHIFSELGSYSISYTNLLHNLDSLDYKSCKQLLGVPYDCGRLSERVSEYVYGRQQFQGSQSDYPTLSRLYGECVRLNLDVAPNVFPLNSDVQSDILHYLSSKENNLLDNNPHLVFVLVFLAYSLLVNNNLHNHYTTCKNKMQVGRFPSNLTHDNSEEVRECFPETKSCTRQPTGKGILNPETGWNQNSMIDKTERGHNDSGNASRFFKSIIYQAKSSKSDRNSNGVVKNIHPTCKPTLLMQYLINMITPKGGIVLDVFAGSGTTCVAAKKLKRNYIGIEIDPEYCKIARARIKAVPLSLI